MGVYQKIAELLGKRVDTPTAVTPSAGEGVPLQVDDEGHLWVRERGDTVVTVLLSESTNGRPIGLGSGGVPIHAAPSGTTTIDKVWIWLSNTTLTDHVVTFEWGGSAASDVTTFTVPAKESVLASPGWPLQNSLIVVANTDVADVINAAGWVERVS